VNTKFGISVQGLFDTYEAMRKAEFTGDRKEAQAQLRNGLLESCRILRFMVSDSLCSSFGRVTNSGSIVVRLSSSWRLAWAEQGLLGRSEIVLQSAASTHLKRERSGSSR